MSLFSLRYGNHTITLIPEHHCSSKFNESQLAWLADQMIAFISNRDGSWKNYQMNTDGSNQKRLTDSDESETAFWRSADGKWVVINSFVEEAYDPNAVWTS